MGGGGTLSLSRLQAALYSFSLVCVYLVYKMAYFFSRRAPARSAASCLDLIKTPESFSFKDGEFLFCLKFLFYFFF